MPVLETPALLHHRMWLNSCTVPTSNTTAQHSCPPTSAQDERQHVPACLHITGALFRVSQFNPTATCHAWGMPSNQMPAVGPTQAFPFPEGQPAKSLSTAPTGGKGQGEVRGPAGLEPTTSWSLQVGRKLGGSLLRSGCEQVYPEGVCGPGTS